MTAVAPKEKYVRGVSFDTMTDKDLPDFSFTLRGKTPGYKRTRRTRTFMVATDLANYSEYALNWASDVCSLYYGYPSGISIFIFFFLLHRRSWMTAMRLSCFVWSLSI